MAQASSKQNSQPGSQASFQGPGSATHALQDRIRIRAYEIFLRRGGQGGSPEEDWILAERELAQEAAGSGSSAGAVAPVAEGRPVPSDGPPKKSVKSTRAGSNTASRRSR